MRLKPVPILLLVFVLAVLLALAAAWMATNWAVDSPTASSPHREYEVTAIPLTEPLGRPSSEVSCLAWYEDYLVILPQYPHIFGPEEDGCLFALPRSELLVETYGQGTTHAQHEALKRLVELQTSESGITLVRRPPLQFELVEETRNWEGIVRLEDRGFLVMTDKFPETVLAFVLGP